MGWWIVPFRKRRRISAALRALLDRLELRGYTVSDLPAMKRWFESARRECGDDGFAIFFNPSTATNFPMYLRSFITGQKISIWWDDGDTDTYTLSSSTNTNIDHIYSGGADRVVIFAGAGNISRIEAVSSSVKFGGNVADLPSGLTSLTVGGNGTLTGDVANLPSGLTYLYILGNSTLTGDVANLPSGLTSLVVGGNGTLTGNVADLPSGLTSLTIWSNNTLTGDVADLPSGLTYIDVRGNNTLTGNVADLPSGLTNLDVRGYNTLTGDVAALPSGLAYLLIAGYNTLTGDVAALPSGLTGLNIHGNNTLTGNVADFPSGINYLSILGSNTIDFSAGIGHLTGITYVEFNNADTAEIDAFIDNTWAARNNFTDSNGIGLRIASCSPPTGPVQDNCPPSTPGEKLYNLRYAQCAGDTHKLWYPIYYNGGTLS